MKLSVSIIIPTFNEEKYLPKLLKSIQSQTYQPKEVIVADAFSTDKTREIAEKFGCKIVDGGLPAKARNNGAKQAKQPILVFLDADVLLPPNFLKNTITEMIDKDLDIASCYARPLSKLKIDKFLHSVANYYMKITSKLNPHIPGFCIFIKKDIHDRIHGFDETLLLGEDHDYVKRAKKFGVFSYLEAYKIPVSIRRLSKEGRLLFALKYIGIELHLIFIGKIKKNIFAYKLNGHM
jgi:glycosyltransferase involved in cell wall biosynthesis